MTLANALNSKLVTYLSNPVDLTTLGSTQLFTTLTSGENFLVIQVVTYQTSLVGINTVAQWNLGWNNPTYDNIYASQSSFDAVGAGASEAGNIQSVGGEQFLVPPNTPVFTDITLASTAATSTVRFVVTGIYVTP